jgi:predicted lipid-binding transport protein (Tim44 family)
MSRLLQWLIGLGVLVLVLALAFSVVAPYFFPRAVALAMPMMNPGLHARMHAGDWTGPMMGGRGGMMGGWGGFGLARLIGPLTLLALVGLGAYLLARRPAPVALPPAPVAQAAVVPAAQAVCAHCGQPVQAGWKACPYCGEKL